MQLLDNYFPGDIEDFHRRFEEPIPLNAIIDVINNYQIVDDEAHNQRINENFTARYFL